jgi:hypothetical protein
MKMAMTLFIVGGVAVTICGSTGARGSHHGTRGPSSAHTYLSPRASDTRTSGYTRRNGTYVHSYMHSAADDTKMNNFSTKGNVNPYTGKVGTKDPNGH